MAVRLQIGKRRKRTAYATVHFAAAKNDLGRNQCCVYAECNSSGFVIGPVWGHSDQAVRRVLALLTQQCDCPATYHRGKDFLGRRVVNVKQPRR